MSRTSLFRTFVMTAALGASSAAFAEPPAKPPAAADKKPADKAPATTDKPADKPADKASDKKPAGKDQVSEEDAQKFLAFFDKLVAIVVTNKEDCTKMAAAVNAHVDANQPLLKEAADAKAAHKEMPQSAKDKIAKKASEELSPAMMAKCSNDRGVMNAFTRLKPPSK